MKFLGTPLLWLAAMASGCGGGGDSSTFESPSTIDATGISDSNPARDPKNPEFQIPAVTVPDAVAPSQPDPFPSDSSST